MLAIQLEDNMAEDISILPNIAVDAESAFALMHIDSSRWITEFSPAGFNLEVVNRPGPALDIVSGDSILASYTVHSITGVFSIHGEFGIEVKQP